MNQRLQVPALFSSDDSYGTGSRSQEDRIFSFLNREEHLRRRELCDGSATGEVTVAGPDRVHIEHIYPQSPKYIYYSQIR
jgi:hypothetical protein